MPEPAPGLRGRIERRSAPALLWFSSRPKVVLPALTVLLLLVGLVAPTPVGVPVLFVLALLIGWLSYLSWPVVSRSGRAVRVVMVALVLMLALTRL